MDGREGARRGVFDTGLQVVKKIVGDGCEGGGAGKSGIIDSGNFNVCDGGGGGAVECIC